MLLPWWYVILHGTAEHHTCNPDYSCVYGRPKQANGEMKKDDEDEALNVLLQCWFAFLSQVKGTKRRSLLRWESLSGFKISATLPAVSGMQRVDHDLSSRTALPRSCCSCTDDNWLLTGMFTPQVCSHHSFGLGSGAQMAKGVTSLHGCSVLGSMERRL